VNKPALVLMARAPVAGAVKTRLQPRLTPEQCVSLYNAFLLDAIELACSLMEYTPFLFFTPKETFDLFRHMAPANMEPIPQTGIDLGEIMDNIINGLLSRGHSPVVIIGSDIPALQPATLRETLKRLEKADLCLGPSSDGGYYLIGATRSIPSVLQGIQWSTPEVLRTTLEKARDSGLSVALLNPLSDIDTYEDFIDLKHQIIQLRSITGSRIPKHTSAWLENHQASKVITGNV
jgi:uncharacterized protein